LQDIYGSLAGTLGLHSITDLLCTDSIVS